MASVLVIGLGRFGSHVVKYLNEEGHQVVAVDINPENVDRVKDVCDKAILMDAQDKEALEAIGTDSIDVAIVSLGERVDVSCLVSLHLKDLGVPRIITKAGSYEHQRLLSLIGVDEIVFPEMEAAERLAKKISGTSLIDIIPLAVGYGIHEIAPPPSFIGHSLAELRIRNRFNVQVIGIRDLLKQELLLNPPPDIKIKDSDSLLILGKDEDLERLEKLE